ncbi:MAG: alpha/beta fold hydrolase [Pseudomonadota bacterium]
MNDGAGLARERVEIASDRGRLRGDLIVPPQPRGCVLLLHGHTGSRDELPLADGQGLFAHSAAQMGAAGYASLRCDFLGSGESDGAWADTTLDGQAADALGAARWLRAHPELASRPLALLGFSQGGLVALLAASQAAAGAAVLWNPVFDPDRSFGLIYGADAMRVAQTADPQRRLSQAGGLRARFFQQASAYRAAPLAVDLALPLLIVASDADRVIPDGPAQAARLAGRRRHSTETLVLAAGHDLGAAQGMQGPDWVIARSIGFLDAHLR